MKKITTLVVATAMATLFAVPVSAAKIDFGGVISNKMWYDFNSGVGSKTELDINLDMSMSSGRNVRANVKFSPIEWTAADGPMGNQTNNDRAMNLGDAIKIESAYIESDGPYWKNGPSVTTRLGDLDLEYSPYILDSEVIEGMSLSNIEIGSVDLGGFYGWHNQKAVYGAKIGTNFSMARVDGSFVKIGEDELDYLAQVVFSPNEKVIVDGLYAGQTNTDASAIRLNGEIALPKDITLLAGYKKTDSDFDPYYRNLKKDNPVDGEQGTAAVNVGLEKSFGIFDLSLNGELSGDDNDGKVDDYRAIGVGAKTQIADLDLSAGYEISRDVKAEQTNHKTTFGVAVTEKEIVPEVMLTASYDATLNNADFKNMRHVLKAELSSDIELLKGVTVSGTIDTEPGVNEETGENYPRYEAKVNYSAPNGVNLGYLYNDLGKNRVSAGMEVEF